MTDRDLQQKRIVAGLIDIGIAVGIWMIFAVLTTAVTFAATKASGGGVIATFVPRLLGFVGALIGLGYILGRDMVAGGRSLGKQLQGIRVVTTEGMPIALMDSVRRNAPFAIGSAFGFLSATLQLVPCLGDAVACVLWPLWVLGGLVSLGIAVFEMIKISQDPDGVRMGDQLANTRVIR